MVYFHCGKIKAIQIVSARCFVVKFVFLVFIFLKPFKVIIVVVSPINVIKTINVIPTINVIKIDHKCNTNHKCNNF